jgi:signal transduction histidine kinase
MEQIEQVAGMKEAERRRVEAVVETLATLHGGGESLAELAHDARNMVTALGLYCDLLEEPGVLSAGFAHYGSELRLVSTASRRLVEKLVTLEAGPRPAIAGAFQGGFVRLEAFPGGGPARSRNWELMPAAPIESLAGELAANRNLLSALAGPWIALTVEVEGGSLPVRLTGEDLTRVLVNLVKNAAEAMPRGGKIALALRERPANARKPAYLLLRIEDSGPGVPGNALDAIFETGYTTRANEGNGSWPSSHRGLGLSITRSIVESAGGRIHAANGSPKGAYFEIELPVMSR